MLVAEVLPPIEFFSFPDGWTFSGLAAGLIVVSAFLYYRGVARLKARGRHWKSGRSVLFGIGLLVMVVATQSPIATYDTTLFWTHATQHILLGMLAPMLLVLGHPVTLALQASSQDMQSALVSGLRSRPVELLVNPFVAWGLFVGSMFVVYFTFLYTLSLENRFVHELIHIHMLATGILFFAVVIGTVATIGVPPHPARMLMAVLLVPVHAVLGIAVTNSEPVLGFEYYEALGRDWGPSLVRDQEIGGSLLWVGGEVLLVWLLMILLGQWFSYEERRGVRLDLAADREVDDAID